MGRQCLVRGKDDCGALGLFDHLGHGEGLAGARRAQQHLIAFARKDTGAQLGNRGRLVACGFKLGLEHEPLAAFHLVAAFHIRRGVRQIDGWGLVGLGIVHGGDSFG